MRFLFNLHPLQHTGFLHVMPNMLRFVFLLALWVLFPRAEATELERTMGTCEMEAMRQFGIQRKPHPISKESWPTDLELEYRESCMRAQGYEHDLDLVIRDGTLRIQGVSRSAPWRWDPKYWKLIKR